MWQLLLLYQAICLAKHLLDVYDDIIWQKILNLQRTNDILTGSRSERESNHEI